jgi:hypothetical protein
LVNAWDDHLESSQQAASWFLSPVKAMRQSQLPIINQHQLVGGIPTPLKNMKVTWDDASQYMEIHKIHVPNHQPVHCGLFPRY